VLIGVSIASGIAGFASADQSFNPEDVAYEYEFGETLTISATVSQLTTIKNITVSLQPENQQSRQLAAISSDNSKIQTTLDLQTATIDPFSRVYFWFNAEMQDGSMVSSPSYWFDYIDNRYQWKTNSSKLFSIHWVSGDSFYGQKIQQISREGLERATQLLPVVPDLPVEIYVYPDGESLRSILTSNSKSWVNGHAFIIVNRIVISDSLPLEDTTDLERTIPHELMHLLQYQVVAENYAYTPAWLTEGLASQTELYPNSTRERDFEKAIETGSLTPLSTLCLGISPDPEQANIDYAHSASLVKYIQNTYGNQIFLSMLQAASSGKDCNSLVNTSLGLSLQRLEDDWHASVTGNSSATTTDHLNPYLWIFLLGVLAVSGVIVLIVRRRRTTHEEINRE
jgi:hypothetical protein